MNTFVYVYTVSCIRATCIRAMSTVATRTLLACTVYGNRFANCMCEFTVVVVMVNPNQQLLLRLLAQSLTSEGKFKTLSRNRISWKAQQCTPESSGSGAQTARTKIQRLGHPCCPSRIPKSTKRIRQKHCRRMSMDVA